MPMPPAVASRFSKRHCRMAKAMLAFVVVAAFIGAWAVLIFSNNTP